MSHDPLVLAYLAGMIDGDGYISIQRSLHKERLYFGPRIGIAGTRREPHDLAASLWGGKVGVYSAGLHRPQFQWSRSGALAAAAISAVRPYLRIKGDQAGLALQLWDHVECGRTDDPYPWFGPNYDPQSESDEMREEMIALNQSRNRVGKKAAGRLLDAVEHNAMPELRR